MAGRQHETPRPVRTRAFIASATKIDLSQRKIAAKQGAHPQQWQADAWDVFDEVPEVKESVWYLGNQIAKLRLFPATIVEGSVVSAFDENSGVPANVAQAAADELARLRSVRGGQADILRKLEMNLEVPGECYIVGWQAREVDVTDDNGNVERVTFPEDWQVRSTDEVENKAGRYYVKDDPTDGSGKGREVVPGEDTIIRVWLEHPRYQVLADSLMRALIVDGRTVSALSQQVYAEALSRHGAGMVLLPIEASFGPDNETEDEGGDEEKRDVFMEEFEASVLDPITDNASSAQVQPMVVRMMAELIDKVKFLTYGRTTDPHIFERIEGCIARIARGLPLPVEKVLGHMNTTFANAEQVDEDEFEDYLGPRADILMDALLFAYYRPQLMENAITAPYVEALVIGYDPSALIAQPDPGDSADFGLEKGLVSGEAWRREKGWTEDDAPDALELLVSAGLRRGILTADLTLALLRLMADAPEIEVSTPATVVPPDPNQVPPEETPAPEEPAALLARILALMTATEPQPLPPGEPPGSPLSRPMWGAPQGQGGASAVAQGSPQRFALSAAARVRTDAGKRLAALDRDLLVRLTVASTDAMERALEKIGNVLRTKASAHRAITAGVPRREVASVLGRTVVRAAAGDAEDLFEGAWDDLEKQFKSWGGAAQEQALDIASQVTSGLSTAEREGLALRQADHLDEAWSWMKQSLSALGAERLFNPNPTDPGIGEFDPNAKVPTGLVRQAVQRAGGSTGISTSEVPNQPNALGPGHSSFVALTNPTGAPDGGIGTGVLVNEVLSDGGAGIEGYVWVYGPAHRARPFEPHVELDGIEFVNFDDDVLANGDSFPETEFYFPGDHAGCICDFEPVILAAVDAGVAPDDAGDVEASAPVDDLLAEFGDLLAGPPTSPVLDVEDDPFARMASDILAGPAASQTAVYDGLVAEGRSVEASLADHYGQIAADDPADAVVDTYVRNEEKWARRMESHGRLQTPVDEREFAEMDNLLANMGGPPEPVTAYLPWAGDIPEVGSTITHRSFVEPMLNVDDALAVRPNAIVQYVIPEGGPAAFVDERRLVMRPDSTWRMKSWELVDTPQGISGVPFIRYEYVVPETIGEGGDLAGLLRASSGSDFTRAQMDMLVGPKHTGSLPDLDLELSGFKSQADYTKALANEGIKALDVLNTADLEEWYFAPRYSEVDGYAHADVMLSKLYANRGFDALPTVVEAGEAQGLADAGWQVVYRGVDATGVRTGDTGALSLLDDLRDGPYFAGEGIYGNGTYTSTLLDEARGYARATADESEEFVATIAIDPDARFIDHHLLRDVQEELTTMLNHWEGFGYDVQLGTASSGETREIGKEIVQRAKMLKQVVNDEGRLATAMGYDGIDATSTYRVVLNRGATAVEKYDVARWERFHGSSLTERAHANPAWYSGGAT
jgi:hypothetical protein